MSDDNPNLISHVSVGVADIDRAGPFYDAVLATLGARRLAAEDGLIAYGKAFPEFWIGPPIDGGAPTVGRGAHTGFVAASREQVHAFHAAALAAGGVDEGAPGPRPHYGPQFYGAFVRDLDGNKIEATFWDAAAA